MNIRQLFGTCGTLTVQQNTVSSTVITLRAIETQLLVKRRAKWTLLELQADILQA